MSPASASFYWCYLNRTLTWRSTIRKRFTLCDMHRIMTWENALLETYLFCTPEAQLACIRRKKVSLLWSFEGWHLFYGSLKTKGLWNCVSILNCLGLYVAFVNRTQRTFSSNMAGNNLWRLVGGVVRAYINIYTNWGLHGWKFWKSVYC